MSNARLTGGKPVRQATFSLAAAWRSTGIISSAALAWAINAPNAVAQCAPDPATAGANVICRGVDADGFNATADNISVTVDVGATVQASTFGRAISLNSPGGQLTNQGAVISSNFIGLELIGSDARPARGTNFGTITSSANFGTAVQLRTVSTFDNHGVVQGTGSSATGVALFPDFTGTFTNSGTISSLGGTSVNVGTAGFAGPRHGTLINTASGQIRSASGTAISVYGGAPFDIINSGLIRGATGIELVAGATLRNEAGATIEGIAGSAVSTMPYSSSPAVITNAGVLTTAGAPVVTGASYVLANSGRIRGDVTERFTSTVQQIVNTGRIEGSILPGAGRDSFENSGFVAGTVNLGAGADIFRDFGGLMSGSVHLDDGDDFVLVKTGVARAAITGGITPGAGLDSFGVSVEGKETVNLAAVAGFEGLAVETRFATSEATLAASSSLTQTLSVLGDGQVINRGSINVVAGDAVRFYSNDRAGGLMLSGPFGSGVKFTNEGVVTAGSAGYAFRSVAQDNAFGSSVGSDRLINNGQIIGQVALDAGDDILINSGQITGNVSLAGSVFVAPDNNRLYNSGIIVGEVTFAEGSDVFVSGGRTTGAIDLGAGDDAFLVDLDANGNPSTGALTSGAGLDVFGIRTARALSASLGLNAGFEGVAVMADGADAHVTILAPPVGQTLPYLRVFGSGAVVNNADILNSNSGSSVFAGAPTVAVMDDGATFTNNGVLAGFQALRLVGSGQTATNNANLQRPVVGGESTGNTGVIQDSGVGNTLVNNGDIDTAVFSMSGVFIGRDTSSRLGENVDTSTEPVSRFTNNGRINSVNASGLRINTNYAVDVLNTGTIDDIAAERSEGGVTIRNSATGSIGQLRINSTSFPSYSEGSFIIINEGAFGVSPTTSVSFSNPFSGVAGGVGVADTIINSGLLRGMIAMNAGADTFVLKNAGVLQGAADGGPDFDTLAFEGVAGAIRASQFSNFERLDISTPDIAVLDGGTGLSSSFRELTVRSGRVRLDADLSMNVNVLGGGVFGGNGIVSGDVLSAGVLSPGASVGVLQINGDLALGPQSSLLVETDASGTDRIVVGGDAQLGGVLHLQSAAHPTRIRTLNFMSVAGATTGSFSSITVDTPSGFSGLTTVLQDAAGQLSLQITPQLAFSSGQSFGTVAAGAYLNQAIASGQTNADTDEILNRLFALNGSPTSLATSLEEVGPTTYAAASWLGSRQALALTDIIRPRFLTTDPPASGVGVWLSGSDASFSAKSDADSGAAGFQVSVTPLIGGVEYSGRGILAGAFAGSVNGEQSLVVGRGDTEADALTAGVYASVGNGLAHVGVSGAFVASEANSRRAIGFLGQVSTADYDLDVWTVQTNAAVDLAIGPLQFIPLVGATFAHVERSAASETGGAGALNVSQASEDFLHVDLGAEVTWVIELGSGLTLRPSIWAGWRYELAGASPTARATLRATGQYGLTAWSARPERDRLTARVGLEALFADTMSAHIRYDAEFGEKDSDDSLTAGVSISF